MRKFTKSLISGVLIMVIFAAIFVAPSPAIAAVKLSLEKSFGGSADGIVFNPMTQSVFRVDTELVSLSPLVTKWSATEYNLEGDDIANFTSEVIGAALGGTRLPNGNLLILNAKFGKIIEMTPYGELVNGGVDITSEALAVVGSNAKSRGMAYYPQTDTIFVLDSGKIIKEIDTTGNLVSTIDLAKSLPNNTCPQGMTIDPVTGNFLLGDQSPEDSCSGTNSIYEVTPSGKLVSSTDVEALTGFGDLEALSIDPGTSTLYAGFDDDAKNGSILAALKVNHVGSSCAIPHSWSENDRKGTVGNIYKYDNPYNGDTEYFELVALGSDERYWYYPTDKTDNSYWKYLGAD